MTSVLFVIAIALVLITLGARRKKKTNTKAIWAQFPGRNAKDPIDIQRFDAIDEFVRRQRCFCGGIPDVVSEGSKMIGNENLRVVRADCGECEEELYFFFRLEEMLH